MTHYFFRVMCEATLLPYRIELCPLAFRKQSNTRDNDTHNTYTRGFFSLLSHLVASIPLLGGWLSAFSRFDHCWKTFGYPEQP